jgi:hypothetical protein
MPLQECLAAGRPAISPSHTAMADYLDERVGLPVTAHPEPTGWPDEPEHAGDSRRYRLVWQSLHDQLRESHALLRGDQRQYRSMAACGRDLAASTMSQERVWPLLASALAAAIEAPANSSAGRD